MKKQSTCTIIRLSWVVPQTWVIRVWLKLYMMPVWVMQVRLPPVTSQLPGDGLITSRSDTASTMWISQVRVPQRITRQLKLSLLNSSNSFRGTGYAPEHFFNADETILFWKNNGYANFHLEVRGYSITIQVCKKMGISSPLRQCQNVLHDETDHLVPFPIPICSEGQK